MSLPAPPHVSSLRPDDASASVQSPRISPIAWFPIPLFLLTFFVLAGIESHEQYGSPFLLIGLNFVFIALTSLVVVFFVARSFLLRGSPGLLLVCCGTLLWGLGSIISIAVDPRDVNTNVTIYNMGAWLAALCHLTGAVISVRPARLLPAPALSLTTGIALTLAALAFVASVAFTDLTPVFFIQGHGGTPIRQAVVTSCIGMFVLTAVLLRAANRRSPSPFVEWYTLSMLLIGTGLFGVLLQSSFGGILNWSARGAQYLGGIYLLIAALASLRDSRDWHISLTTALSEARQRYEDLFHLAVDGIVVYELPDDSATGRIVEANPAACELLGYGLEELHHLPPRALAAPENVADLFEGPVLSRAGAIRREVTLIARSGRRISAEISLRLFRESGTPMVMAIIRDVTARKAAEQRLHEMAQRLTWHVENSPLAVLEWGPDLRLTRWSGQAEDLFGWSAAEVLGKGLRDFRWIHPDDEGEVEQVFQPHSGKIRRFSSHRHYRRDGSMLRCDWYNSSLLDDAGNLRSILSLVLDVTARTEAERNLHRVNTDLEQFAFAASHDLQEPLRTVSIYSELLARRHASALDPQAGQYLAQITGGTKRMLTLMADLRTYLHAPSNAAVAPERADANDCLREVLETLASVILQENAMVSSSSLPSVAIAPVHLRQIFQNLLSNALKFRGVAPPAICISAEPVGTMWRFAVRDNGIGIDPQYAVQIFGVFKRLHPHSRYDGSGIGLAICQKIVERYGGSIRVDSAIGHGSTFYFTVPDGRALLSSMDER